VSGGGGVVGGGGGGGGGERCIYFHEPCSTPFGLRSGYCDLSLSLADDSNFPLAENASCSPGNNRLMFQHCWFGPQRDVYRELVAFFLSFVEHLKRYTVILSRCISYRA